nr:MAG TPA: hypothetical protein [Crassvirales sp.]
MKKQEYMIYRVYMWIGENLGIRKLEILMIFI